MVTGTITCIIIIGDTTIGIGDLVGTVGMDLVSDGVTIIGDGMDGTEIIMDIIMVITILTIDGIMGTTLIGMAEEEAIIQAITMVVEEEILQILVEAV